MTKSFCCSGFFSGTSRICANSLFFACNYTSSCVSGPFTICMCSMGFFCRTNRTYAALVFMTGSFSGSCFFITTLCVGTNSLLFAGLCACSGIAAPFTKCVLMRLFLLKGIVARRKRKNNANTNKPKGRIRSKVWKNNFTSRRKTVND